MLAAWPPVKTDQDDLFRPSAQRPQLRTSRQAFSATPQPIILAEASRVREGDPEAELVEWI